MVGTGDDAALTAGVIEVSEPSGRLDDMTDDNVEIVIRQAIGGDTNAISQIVDQAATSENAVVIAMAALLQREPLGLERARAVASTSRDRQLVEIARNHLDGATELVDALARDHLVDYPDSLVVAWIASDAVVRARRKGTN
jgi:hypothetical protein